MDEEPDWVKDFTQDIHLVESSSSSLSESVNGVTHTGVPVEEGVEDTPDPNPIEKRDQGDGKKHKDRLQVTSLPLKVGYKADSGILLAQPVDDIDLSGDVGAIGRVKVTKEDVFLDLKGIVYRAANRQCNTMGIISLHDDEARVVNVVDQIIVLHPEGNFFKDLERLEEGELDDLGVNPSDGEGDDVEPRREMVRPSREQCVM
mmetsp:Transcript_16161/g.32711  ORF Transcript_16161/g.32711 Transcript_16161/m.32711 type:complete len:203 (-) Transcript_16161:5819-6427(-)